MDEYRFHRISTTPGGGIGLFAELFTVAQPVTAHRHDFYELAFALTSSGQHEDAGGRLPILSGDVWMIRPGQWHAYPLVGGRLQVFNLLMTKEFQTSYAPTLDQTCLGLGMGAPSHDAPRTAAALAIPHLRLSPQGLDRIHALLVTLSRELHAALTPGQTCLCSGLALQILGLLDRYGRSGPQQSPAMQVVRDDPGVMAAVQHIEDAYAETVTLHDLARRSGYAATYLTRKFKECLGKPPSDYLLQVRLHHACALLEMTDLSVTTIAHQVGFSDSRYFATRFHRAVGLTPTGFRIATQGQNREQRG